MGELLKHFPESNLTEQNLTCGSLKKYLSNFIIINTQAKYMGNRKFTQDLHYGICAKLPGLKITSANMTKEIRDQDIIFFISIIMKP